MDDVLATYKQLEHTLRYLAVVAEQADEGVAAFDPAGAVVFVNPAWAGMHGYRTTAELVGRPINVFHTEEQMQARPTSGGQAGVTAFIEEAKRTGQRMGLVEHVTSDGTPFLTQTKVIVVQDEAGRATGLVAFARDTTQMRRLEEQLREHSRRTAQLAEQIARLQELFGRCQEVEQSLTRQAAELEADARELGRRIAERAQSQQIPQPHTDPLSQSTCPTDGGREPKSAAPCLSSRREKIEHKCVTRRRTDGQAADALLAGSDASPGAAPTGRTPRSDARRYPLDAEELRKVAELGRRLAGLS